MIFQHRYVMKIMKIKPMGAGIQIQKYAKIMVLLEYVHWCQKVKFVKDHLELGQKNIMN